MISKSQRPTDILNVLAKPNPLCRCIKIVVFRFENFPVHWSVFKKRNGHQTGGRTVRRIKSVLIAHYILDARQQFLLMSGNCIIYLITNCFVDNTCIDSLFAIISTIGIKYCPNIEVFLFCRM